jgi:hypothetical protein
MAEIALSTSECQLNRGNNDIGQRKKNGYGFEKLIFKKKDDAITHTIT